VFLIGALTTSALSGYFVHTFAESVSSHDNLSPSTSVNCSTSFEPYGAPNQVRVKCVRILM